MTNKLFNIKERFLYFLKNQGYKVKENCEKIGMTYGNFTGENKKTPLNSNALSNILSNFSELSITWLLSGDGEMLNYSEETLNDKLDNSISLVKKDSQIKQRLLNYLKQNQVTIDTFCLKTSFSKSFLNHNDELSEYEIIQIATTFDELNLEWLLLGKGEMNKQVVTIDNDVHKAKIQELMSVIRDKDKIIKLQEKLLNHDCIDEKMQNAG